MQLVHHGILNFQVRLDWNCSALLQPDAILLSSEVSSDMREADRDSQYLVQLLPHKDRTWPRQGMMILAWGGAWAVGDR
jgi:hypothetical protein